MTKHELEIKNEWLNICINRLNRLLDYEVDKQNKYKQALIEVKEVAEICSNADSNEILLKRIKHILREINEVLDD